MSIGAYQKRENYIARTGKVSSRGLKGDRREIFTIGIGISERIQIIGDKINNPVAVKIIKRLLECSRRAIAGDLKRHREGRKPGNRGGLELNRIIHAAIGVGETNHGTRTFPLLHNTSS